MLMRIPVKIVGAAAGKMTKNAFLNELTSSVLATFNHSFLTEETPKAVFISIGQIEQMKITKIPDKEESLIV